MPNTGCRGVIITMQAVGEEARIGSCYSLEGIDPQHIGVQHDLRHAVVEGYRSWENGFQLIKDRITTIDVKDFKWHESNGKDVPITVPLGKGNVDFSKLISSRPF